MGKRSRARKSGKPAETEPAPSFAARDDNMVIAGLFFASGLSSLIYQVVWTRMLVLVFGATTFATSTVLAVFMGGLALGSFIAGRKSDSIKRPLLWYGILEAVIGIWALLTPLLFDAATPLYKLIWQQTHASLLPFSLLRLLCTGFILLVPTTCMGATLPLLARHVTTRLSTVGSRVGLLYSVNTCGAIAGAALTGFSLLPNLGLSTTIFVAVAINALLFAAVLVLEKRTRAAALAGQAQAAAALPDTAPTSKTALSLSSRLALIAFAVSGGIAMTYEVCWTRALLMVIGSSTYAFTVMLCAFLCGLFFGSLVCARFIDRFSRPLLCFAILQLLLGLLTIISMREFNYLPYWNVLINARQHFDSNGLMLVRFLLAGSVLMPVTFCLGAIFPAVVKACTVDLSAIGRSVGTLYSINTLGAIVGALLAGFVLLPWLGAEYVLLSAALVNLLLGVVLLLAVPDLSQRHKLIILGVSGLLNLVLGGQSAMWNHNVLLNAQSSRRGLMLGSYIPASFEQFKDLLNQQFTVDFWADGPCSNVGILHATKSNTTMLVTNGHIDASDDADMSVQTLLAGFPLLLKPRAEDIAIIGWGSGQTVGTATLFPVKSIEAVELEKTVLPASKFFHHVNHKPELDERVHLQFNDGRNYLLATDKKFDIIMSEPSNPWQAGVCNLFSQEYFRACHDRLKPNGLFSLWLQIGEVPLDDVRGVLSALHRSFKHIMILSPNSGNMIALASDSPLRLDMENVRKVLSDPVRKAAFATAGLPNAESLVAHIITASDAVDNLISDAPPNSDDNNRLEFNVGKSYESCNYLPENRAKLLSHDGNPWDQIDWGTMSKEAQAKSLGQIGRSADELGNASLAEKWLDRSIKVQPTLLACKSLAAIHYNQRKLKLAENEVNLALKLQPTDFDMMVFLGLVHLGQQKQDLARADFQRALDLDPNNFDARYFKAITYSNDMLGPPYSAAERQQHKDQTALTVRQLLEPSMSKPELAHRRPLSYLVCAHACFKLGDLDKAQAYDKEYLLIEPQNAAANQLLKAIAEYRAQHK